MQPRKEEFPADIAIVQNFIHGFFKAWDERDADRIASMMAQDATWLRAGRIKTGPAGAREAMAERRPNTVTAHIVNNIHVQEAESTLVACCYVTTYNEQAVKSGVVPLVPPRSIVAYEFVLEKAASGEVLVKRIGTSPVFRREG